MTTNKETKGGSSLTPGYFVHIIESPSPDDLLNNRMEGRLLTEALSLSRIISTYNLAANYATFTKALGPILYEAMQDKGVPILHLSTHGNEKGIELTDGVFLEWDKLRELLLPINRVLDGGLVICMSSCSGYSGCRMAMSVNEEMPFSAVIGHTGTAYWSNTGIGFVAFYHRLFKGTSVPDAVEAMRMASGDKGFLQILASDAKKTWVEIVEKQREKERIERMQRALEEYRRKYPPRLGG